MFTCCHLAVLESGTVECTWISFLPAATRLACRSHGMWQQLTHTMRGPNTTLQNFLKQFRCKLSRLTIPLCLGCPLICACVAKLWVLMLRRHVWPLPGLQPLLALAQCTDRLPRTCKGVKMLPCCLDTANSHSTTELSLSSRDSGLRDCELNSV